MYSNLFAPCAVRQNKVMEMVLVANHFLRLLESFCGEIGG
jgi:hypothetical protein